MGIRSQKIWLQIYWLNIGELERQNPDKITNNLGKEKSWIYMINQNKLLINIKNNWVDKTTCGL